MSRKKAWVNRPTLSNSFYLRHHATEIKKIHCIKLQTVVKSGTHDTDKLLALLKQGDAKAFETIYNNYAEELYRHARRVIPNREDCEEILQTVFESLWRWREKSDIKSLRAYLYKAVGFKVADYLKQKSIHQRYVEHFRIFEAVYDHAGDREKVAEMIQSGLEKLPKRLQEIVYLRLNENLSNDEIAKRLQLSHATVNTYMHQAYDRFRAWYIEFSKQ